MRIQTNLHAGQTPEQQVLAMLQSQNVDTAQLIALLQQIEPSQVQALLSQVPPEHAGLLMQVLFSPQVSSVLRGS